MLSISTPISRYATLRRAGLLNAYTDLENPDFARVAQAIGFYAQRVENWKQLCATGLPLRGRRCWMS